MESSFRGKELAALLYESFYTTGIFGRNDMPEDTLPDGMVMGSAEHINFITLTVSIDYQRDAPAVWKASRMTFEDPDTKYLFYPDQVFLTDFRKIVIDMQKYKLSKKPQRDASIWKTISNVFYGKWNGDVMNFLQSCSWDSLVILGHLKSDNHLSEGKCVNDFPNLRGNKIGPLWLRMLRDNVGLTNLTNLDKVPVPVDVHIARATMATGIVRGHYDGSLEDFYQRVREAWFENVKGLTVKSRPMISLDIDEPLWHLSKYGCSKNRDKETGKCSVKGRCEAGKFCIEGLVKLEKGKIEIDT